MALVLGWLLFLLLCFVLGVKEQAKAKQNKVTSMTKEEDRDRDKDKRQRHSNFVIMILRMCVSSSV